jgi:hypothetical protein
MTDVATSTETSELVLATPVRRRISRWRECRSVDSPDQVSGNASTPSPSPSRAGPGEPLNTLGARARDAPRRSDRPTEIPLSDSVESTGYVGGPELHVSIGKPMSSRCLLPCPKVSDRDPRSHGCPLSIVTTQRVARRPSGRCAQRAVRSGTHDVGADDRADPAP